MVLSNFQLPARGFCSRQSTDVISQTKNIYNVHSKGKGVKKGFIDLNAQ